MDTTLLVALVGVGGVVAGASTTAAVSLLTGWLARRNEQRRWVLDRRLEAFLAFNKAIAQWGQGNAPKNERQAIINRLVESADQLILVASERVATQAQKVLNVALVDWNATRTKDPNAKRPPEGAYGRETGDLILMQRLDLEQRRGSRRELKAVLQHNDLMN